MIFYRACRLDLKGIIPYTVEEDMFCELIESAGFPAPEAAGENYNKWQPRDVAHMAV